MKDKVCGVCGRVNWRLVKFCNNCGVQFIGTLILVSSDFVLKSSFVQQTTTRTTRTSTTIMLDQNLSKMLIIFQNESRKWGFPKGKMLDTEMACRDYFTCAKRELYEETGIMLNCNKYKKLGSIIIKNKLFYITMSISNLANLSRRQCTEHPHYDPNIIPPV